MLSHNKLHIQSEQTVFRRASTLPPHARCLFVRVCKIAMWHRRTQHIVVRGVCIFNKNLANKCLQVNLEAQQVNVQNV